MRLDRLTVNLRARSPWEAVELGSALVRHHAAAIWKPWLLATLPLFAAINALAWAFDLFWLAGFVVWWLKPVFERVPLYVLSRAVFGAVPGTRETLVAQLRWGWKPMLHYLTWRRLGPARSLYLPIDLLEGAADARLRERRRVIGGAVYGHAALLTVVFWHFELALALGSVATLLMFVPPEHLPETLRAGWMALLRDPPAWAQLLWNFAGWLAMTAIAPFYIGAGFGLYLNRRTQIEAWDVEIAFRRLRERLRSAAAPLLVLLFALSATVPLRAQERDEARTPSVPMATTGAEATDDDAQREPPTLPLVLGEQRVDDAAFRKAVERAYADPLLGAKRKVKQWQKRNPDQPRQAARADMPWLAAIARVFAFIGEWGLWIVAGLLLVLLLATMKHWLPWMRGTWRPRKATLAGVETEALEIPELLPPDIAASARRLWREGRPRHALALLYRASVDGMAARIEAVLPPGATEAECLRASRRLADGGSRELFARMVRVWQYAAYAQRLPGDEEFEELLGRLQRDYGWAA